MSVRTYTFVKEVGADISSFFSYLVELSDLVELRALLLLSDKVSCICAVDISRSYSGILTYNCLT